MRKTKLWEREIKWAKIICANFGCVVEPSAHAYEIATVKSPSVQLVIYEHRTKTTNNISPRVRDNGSKDKSAAAFVMRALNHGDGLPEKDRAWVFSSNTFSHHIDSIRRLGLSTPTGAPNE